MKRNELTYCSVVVVVVAAAAVVAGISQPSDY
jgi:hypothetical protein